MELWIRSSQRKIIVKCDCLSILKGNEVYSKKDKYEYEYDKFIVCQCYGNNFVAPLGTYKTEERALEVLDEISVYKDKLDKSNFLGMTESEFVSHIFEMPEE